MTIRFLLATIVLAALLVFTLQNTAAVNVQLFAWSFKLSRALLILVPFLVGLLLGWALGTFGRARRKAKADKLIPY